MKARAVRIVTDVAAIDRSFDYLVTEKTSQVSLGDRVRIDFNNRSVRGWVIGDAEPSVDLKPLTKWLGFGPPPAMLDLLSWVGQRWFSPLSRVLISTSPHRIVATLPEAPVAQALSASIVGAVRLESPGVIQVAPTTDPLPLVLGAYQQTFQREGSLLVLVPNEAWANRLRGRLEQRGCSVASGESQWDRMRAGWPVVVGPRGTALAPVPRVSGAVIIDGDDEAFRSEGAPTWDAFTVVQERCRRDDAPLWVTSVVPSPTIVGNGAYRSEAGIELGWPSVKVVDGRQRDPHDGVLSREALEVAHEALSGAEAVAVVVVLQRLGTGRLLACRRCGELARCPQCGQAEQEVDDLVGCGDRHEMRLAFCRACGASALKRVKVGVTTLARDVAAQLSQTVTEVTASTVSDTPLGRVVVGTEAVWQRVRRCGVVVFVDFDQYLLATRAEARRSAVVAVGKAARLVGSRRDGRGTVVLQTRRPDDPVVSSLVNGCFDELIDDDVATARELGLAPFGAQARISGPGAAEFVEGLVARGVVVDYGDQEFVARAGDAFTLTDALRAVPRPPQRLRVAVT